MILTFALEEQGATNCLLPQDIPFIEFLSIRVA
jgi:hypothetical protein